MPCVTVTAEEKPPTQPTQPTLPTQPQNYLYIGAAILGALVLGYAISKRR